MHSTGSSCWHKYAWKCAFPLFCLLITPIDLRKKEEIECLKLSGVFKWQIPGKTSELNLFNKHTTISSETMLKFITLVGLCFALSRTAVGYTCSCYCANNYVGTAYSSSCDSFLCQVACYDEYSNNYYCFLISHASGWASVTESNFHTSIFFSRSCSASSSDADSWTSTTWSIGAIVGVVFGCLAGTGILVGIIAIAICQHKKKSARVWAIPIQSQQMGQASFINLPSQQWPSGVYPPAPISQWTTSTHNLHAYFSRFKKPKHELGFFLPSTILILHSNRQADWMYDKTEEIFLAL